MRKFLLSLAALFSAATVFADTYQTTIESKVWGEAGTQTLSDVDWTLATDGGYFGYADKGQQIGSGSKPATTVTLSTNGIAGTITSIVVNTSGASSVVATVSASVGGTNYGDAQSISATATNYTFTGSASGEIVLSWANSSAKALYVKSIEIEYTPAGGGSADPVAVESVSITDSKGEALGYYTNLTVSETLQLKAVVSPANATNKKVSWEAIQDSEVVRVEDGLVTALAPGLAAVVVTTEDGEKQAFNYINVTAIADTTIAAFIASEGMTCYLTGTVSEITNTTYGNFTLTDASGSIIVYGCLTPEGESKKFADLNVKEGDVVKVLAKTYEYYKGTTHEAKDVVFVENFGTPAPAETFPTMAMSYDSLANTVTFTPSDLDAYYFVTVMPVAMMEEMEIDPETINAESIEGMTWAELTDESDPVLSKGVAAVELAAYLAQLGDAAYGEWIAVANFYNEKLQSSETIKYNFTVNKPEEKPTFPTMSMSYDSLANTVTFTPSDLDAYYFVTVMPVAMMEEMEIDPETINAESIEGMTWAELTDESDPVLSKGVAAVELAAYLAQLGDAAYGEWIAVANFYNEKLQSSEAIKYNFTVNKPEEKPTFPTMAMSYDSLANTVTFTPSDLDAYYFVTVMPVAMMEEMELDPETINAESIEGMTWAELTDESDPVLSKGVAAVELDAYLAQLGDAAYGEWIAVANFYNEKLQSSEAIKYNFTVNKPKVREEYAVVNAELAGVSRPVDLGAKTIGAIQINKTEKVDVEYLTGSAIEYADGSVWTVKNDIYSSGIQVSGDEIFRPSTAEENADRYFGVKLTPASTDSLQIKSIDLSLAAGNAFLYKVVVLAEAGDTLYATDNIKVNNYNNKTRYYGNEIVVASDTIGGLTQTAWDQLVQNGDPIASAFKATKPLGTITFTKPVTVKVMFWDKNGKSLTFKHLLVDVVKYEPTGIATVASSAADAPIYNVLGQRVNASAKGLLIRSNKTVLVK